VTSAFRATYKCTYLLKSKVAAVKYGYRYGYGMGMGTVINLHWLMEILWGFLDRCEIQWQRIKHGVNVIADV